MTNESCHSPNTSNKASLPLQISLRFLGPNRPGPNYPGPNRRYLIVLLRPTTWQPFEALKQTCALLALPRREDTKADEI